MSIRLDLYGSSIRGEVPIYKLVEVLSERFDKTEEEINEFFGIDNSIRWDSIEFDDITCLEDVEVDEEVCDELKSLQDELEKLKDELAFYEDSVLEELKPIGEYYWIEGGRNDESKLGKTIANIVRKFNL